MAKIWIGCRLPNGLVLQHPDREKRDAFSVRLKGAKEETVIGSGYGLTEVDEDLWATWKAAYGRGYKPFESGAIFEANSAKQAEGKGKELKSEKTGFEPISPNAPGIKPADKE